MSDIENSKDNGKDKKNNGIYLAYKSTSQFISTVWPSQARRIHHGPCVALSRPTISFIFQISIQARRKLVQIFFADLDKSDKYIG
jgi:hypothetical protein